MYLRLRVPICREIGGCRHKGLWHEIRWGTGMSFSLPRFLRHIRPSDLGDYFEQRDIRFPERLDWSAVPAKLLACLKAAIEALPDEQRERVLEDFERVHQLTDDIGQCSLLAPAEPDGALLRRFQNCHGHQARGLLVLLANEEAFDHALATAYAERMRSGRSWSGYQVSESATPSSNSADIELLKTDLRALFRDLDGSGRKLKIDVFERRTCSIRGGPTARVIHYTVYVEGLPESSVEFERDEPKRRTRRPVIEAAICFEPETGILDIMSKGGKDTREGIARSFAIRLMGSDKELQPVRRRDFELDRLKKAMPFPTDPADGIKSVTVTLLRLSSIGGRFARVTIETDEGTDIHAASARWFGDGDPLQRSEWHVTQAKLRIAFHPEANGKREKAINVELRAPNGSNLKDQTQRHQMVSEKYLILWGLVRGEMAAAA
jgi:hypothetical protein